MKLHEIASLGKMPDYPQSAVDDADALLKHGSMVKQFRNLQIWKVAEDDITWLGLYKDEALIGWLKLRPTVFHGQDVNVVEMLYVIPTERKTITVENSHLSVILSLRS